MNSEDLYYVLGNVGANDSDKERQMEATSTNQVLIAERNDENKPNDQWTISPEPKDGIQVTFKSKTQTGSYLGIKNTVVCVADLSTNAIEFRVTLADERDNSFYIQAVQGSPDCQQKYLTMDDPKGGKQISLGAKMTKDTHKQKWKFNKVPGGSTGTN